MLFRSGPQVEQTALLASPIYIRQAWRGGEKTGKKRSQRARGLSRSLLFVSFVSHALMPRGCIFLYFLNKTDPSKNCNTDCLRPVGRRGLLCPSLQIFVVTKQNRGDYTPLTNQPTSSVLVGLTFQGRAGHKNLNLDVDQPGLNLRDLPQRP